MDDGTGGTGDAHVELPTFRVSAMEHMCVIPADYTLAHIARGAMLIRIRVTIHKIVKCHSLQRVVM